MFRKMLKNLFAVLVLVAMIVLMAVGLVVLFLKEKIMRMPPR